MYPTKAIVHAASAKKGAKAKMKGMRRSSVTFDLPHANHAPARSMQHMMNDLVRDFAPDPPSEAMKN